MTYLPSRRPCATRCMCARDGRCILAAGDTAQCVERTPVATNPAPITFRFDGAWYGQLDLPSGYDATPWTAGPFPSRAVAETVAVDLLNLYRAEQLAGNLI